MCTPVFLLSYSYTRIHVAVIVVLVLVVVLLVVVDDDDDDLLLSKNMFVEPTVLM